MIVGWRLQDLHAGVTAFSFVTRHRMLHGSSDGTRIGDLGHDDYRANLGRAGDCSSDSIRRAQTVVSRTEAAATIALFLNQLERYRVTRTARSITARTLAHVAAKSLSYLGYALLGLGSEQKLPERNE